MNTDLLQCKRDTQDLVASSDTPRNRNGRKKGYIENLLCSLLLLCGDVLENPGPVKNLCGLCDKPVKRNQKAIECEECFKWYHVKCMSITAKSYEKLQQRLQACMDL